MISLFSKQARKLSRGYITRPRLSSATCMLIGTVLFLGPLTQLHSISRAETPRQTPQTRQQIPLPTPRSHYDTFKPGTTGLPLLLDFLDHLSDDRLLDKLVSLAYLPPGTSRGDYLKEFVSKVPSLQKLGQILARNPDLSPDYRKALQDLENGIHTMTREELVTFISDDVGKPEIDKYQVQFADHILAEASV